mgnify:CR=1 FL=1
MAVKGDRERLEPVAKMLYCDGKSLTAIEEALGVSRNTLAEWRDWAGWDQAKAAKDGYEAKLLTVRDELMLEIEAKPLTATTHLDALSKIEAILERRTKAAREAADTIARQRGEMFLQFIKDLIDYGGKHAPEITTVMQDNFDDLIQWGRDKYAA